MSKQSMREEAERLIRETMEKKSIVIKQGSTRIDTTCGKCGAPNRVSAEKGVTRVKFACKECGHNQATLRIEPSRKAPRHYENGSKSVLENRKPAAVGEPQRVLFVKP